MAKLSRRRAHRITAALAVAIAVLSEPGHADGVGAEAVDLVGAWHVLIHFTDDHTHNPDQMRWDDKVWVFEHSGSRLRWIEYPIVVFTEQTGRFDRSQGRLARVLHGWEPNAAQLAQITAGLEVNNRGSKSKTLRKYGDDDWRAAMRPAAASASIVTYVENWSIEDASSLPTFRREDVLGSARMESASGVTEFATTEVATGGNLLRGAFERDGTRHGTFRLMRSGSPQSVKGRAKSEGQRFYREFLGQFGAAVAEGSTLRSAIARRAQADGEVSDEIRARARADIRAALEKSIRDAGEEPRLFEREVDSLARQIEGLVFDEGNSLEEIEQMIQDGQLNP